MPYPTRPTLALSRVSNTAFNATISGGGVANTHRLFYRLLGATSDTTGGTLVGNGVITTSFLESQGQYLVHVVADDNLDGYSLPAIGTVSLVETDSPFTAIHAKWNGSPSLVAAVTGGLWSGEVPEYVEPPYCHFDSSIVSSRYVFEDEIEEARVTFMVYAFGYQATYDLCRQIKATFDYQTLTFSTSGSVGIWPITWRVSNEGLRWKDNRLVHRGTVSYRMAVHRTRSSF